MGRKGTEVRVKAQACHDVEQALSFNRIAIQVDLAQTTDVVVSAWSSICTKAYARTNTSFNLGQRSVP